MSEPVPPSDDLVEFSRLRIEKGSKSFAVAAKIFEPDIRSSAYMLYAWCRHCDDVTDGQSLGFNLPDGPMPTGTDAVAAVDELEAKTRAACAGQADEPVFEALKTVCAQHAIPERYPLDLIAGFRMDADERKYRTIDDTLLYCYHVAGVVGVMMAMIMGPKDRAVLDRASDLGIAFQLTNIARDIVSDHEVGRIYVPEEWLADAGLTPADMAERGNRQALSTVANRLLDMAEPYYDSAAFGIPHLPMRSAWAVASALKVYRAIGLEVRRRGSAAWDSRAGTSKLSKLGNVTSGLAIAAGSRLNLGRQGNAARHGLWTMPD